MELKNVIWSKDSRKLWVIAVGDLEIRASRKADGWWVYSCGGKECQMFLSFEWICGVDEWGREHRWYRKDVSPEETHLIGLVSSWKFIHSNFNQLSDNWHYECSSGTRRFFLRGPSLGEVWSRNYWAKSFRMYGFVGEVGEETDLMDLCIDCPLLFYAIKFFHWGRPSVG